MYGHCQLRGQRARSARHNESCYITRISTPIKCDMAIRDVLGFLPESDWEKAVCDSILVSLNDTLQEVAYKVYVVTVYKNTVSTLTL